MGEMGNSFYPHGHDGVHVVQKKNRRVSIHAKWAAQQATGLKKKK